MQLKDMTDVVRLWGYTHFCISRRKSQAAVKLLTTVANDYELVSYSLTVDMFPYYVEM